MQTRWMRRHLTTLIAPLVLLALLAASCGDDGRDEPAADGTTTTTVADDDGTATSTAPSTTARTAEPHPGVSEDAIRIGVLALDWQALADAGVDLGRGTSTDLYVAALEGINERGGVHGRMLDLHVQEIFPIGAEAADEACVALTEDEEVFLTFGAMLQDSVLCYTEVHESAVINFSGRTEEREERAEAPYVTLLATQSVLAADFVTMMEARGVFEGKTIGVLGSVDADEQAYVDLFDAFVDAGYDPVPGLIGANQDDLAASESDQALILERFTTEGVDVTVSATGLPIVLANAVQAGYQTEQWVFSSLPDGRELADGGVDPAYIASAVGATASPVGTSAQPTLDEDPAVAACLDQLDAATGRTADLALDVSPNDLSSYLFACAGAVILERALTAAGPELDYVSLQAGFESIGDFELAGFGPANLSAGSLGAIDTFSYVEFDHETGVWNFVE